LYFVTQLTALMLVWTVAFICWLILVKTRVRICYLSWQSIGRQLTIMMATKCSLRAEYGYCTVKQKCENILHNVVKVTNILLVSLAIPYIAIRIMDYIALLDSGYVNNYRNLN
jgi:hypothetical protein